MLGSPEFDFGESLNLLRTIIERPEVRVLFVGYCLLRHLKEYERTSPEACKAIMGLAWIKIMRVCARGDDKASIWETAAILVHDAYWKNSCKLEEAVEAIAKLLADNGIKSSTIDRAFGITAARLLHIFAHEDDKLGAPDLQFEVVAEEQ
jgi:hypothetical protein